MRLAFGMITVTFAALITSSHEALASDPKLEELLKSAGLTEAPVESLGNHQYFDNPHFVILKEGKVAIQRTNTSSNSKKFEENGVIYSGTSNGEWGGKLSVTQNKSTKVLMEGNIVQLLPVLDGLYVFEGLAHLGSSKGSVYVIQDRRNPVAPERLTLLPDAPVVVSQDKTRIDYQPILIAGNMGVMRILPRPFEALEILYWDAFWSHKMQPTSIARYEDNYLVGLPHGVAVIPMTAQKKVRFFAEKSLIDRMDSK